jgi:hypothetical protein
MTIQHMRIACWIPKGTNTHSEYVMFIFHCNIGCTNSPECYVVRTCPVLFTVVHALRLIIRQSVLNEFRRKMSWCEKHKMPSCS